MSLFTHILIKNSCVHVLMSPLDCCGNTREFASWDVCTISLNNTGGAAGGSGDWVDEELVTDRDDMFAAEQGAGLSLSLSALCPLPASLQWCNQRASESCQPFFDHCGRLSTNGANPHTPGPACFLRAVAAGEPAPKDYSVEAAATAVGIVRAGRADAEAAAEVVPVLAELARL